MNISLWSVPRDGHRIYGLVVCSDYRPERKLEADDPVWASSQREFHWSHCYFPRDFGCRPREGCKFWVAH
jgi:hypothetical protein